jgi:hypothetical protein
VYNGKWNKNFNKFLVVGIGVDYNKRKDYGRKIFFGVTIQVFGALAGV